MKKIYQTPNITVVNTQTTQIMAGSVKVGQEYQNGDVTLSRRRGFWDDDDSGEE